MPNWSATNYRLTGDRGELQKFADTLNTMPDSPNRFGRYWMGNLLIAFGMSREEAVHGPICCRGIFDPNPDALACFCGPDVDESQTFKVDDDGVMRFSTISAWNRCGQLEEIIKEHFPSVEFAWTSTDEFGNYHLIHDPEDIGHFDRYSLNDGNEETFYGPDEFDEFRQDLINVCTGLDIPEDATAGYLESDGFIGRFLNWRNGKEEREFIGYAIWKEV